MIAHVGWGDLNFNKSAPKNKSKPRCSQRNIAAVSIPHRIPSSLSFFRQENFHPIFASSSIVRSTAAFDITKPVSLLFSQITRVCVTCNVQSVLEQTAIVIIDTKDRHHTPP